MSSESGFSAALAAWRDINLAELQKTLDGQGLEIVENQKEGMLGRKRLAEQTREFKKVAEEDKAAAFKTLLKAYQMEIDALTRRSKTTENSFLNVYKLLAEAPDPFPLLDAAVDQTARASEARLLEGEVARQKEEVAMLRQQLVDAQNVEKERKKLADRVDRFETTMEEMIQEKVATKEAELHATYDERLRNYDEREKDLQRQVTVARTQLRDLRTSNDTSQAKLFDHSERQDQETIARLAEADIITEDLERANSRVAEVERRNEKLRAEIVAVRSGSESAAKVNALEVQISDLQTEASRLLRSLELQQEDSKKSTAVSKKRVEELSREKEGREREVEVFKEKMRQYADYDEIKRELDIMKYVEFAGMDLDETRDDSLHLPDPNAHKANRQQGKPLESLLMAKNAKLQDDLTLLRVAHEELSSTHSMVHGDLEGLHTRFEEQRTLNDRLENDLLRINQSTDSGRASGNVTPSGEPLAGMNFGRRDSGLATTLPFANSAETSILPIITSQRDRFRQRNAELEEELRRQFDTISELRGEIKSLQADNLKLYEKVRYLQSYRDDAGPSNGSRTSFPPASRGDEELGKYRSKYEEAMNPFEAFRGREKGRAASMLNPLEKVLLGGANIVLSNRYMRNLFVLYSFGLHFILLITLYSYATDLHSSVRHVGTTLPVGGP